MKDLDGICVKCGEHTTAGDSCCGFGAIVEGDVIGDDRAQEMLEQDEE